MYKAAHKPFRFPSEMHFYEWFKANPSPAARAEGKAGNEYAFMQAEQTWMAFGEPYYKIWPDMARAMSEVSIEIPNSSFKMPYPSFAILLPRGDRNTLRDPNGPALKTIIVYEFLNSWTPDSNEFKITHKHELASGAHRAIQVNYEFDTTWKGVPSCFHSSMSMYDGGSMEAEFEKSFEHSSDTFEKSLEAGEYAPPTEPVGRIMRLAVATCFFGIDQHELVMPDLPRRKIEKRAVQRNISHAAAYRELAREMNATKMWTIGSEIALPPVEYVKKEERTDGGEVREWTHAVTRRGHMRWQAHGPERKERKLIFVHPHICRPDLPFAKVHGYKIPDKQT